MGRVTVARIVLATAAVAGVEVEALQARDDRSVHVRAARARAILIARRLRPDVSAGRLGVLLGGRKGPTIVQLHGRAEAAYENRPDERGAVRVVLDALGVAELPPYAWTACARTRLEPLDRLIADTEAKLAVYRARRAALVRAA